VSDTLREEFNQWVRSGRSAGLESHHRGFLEQTIPLMNIGRRDRILDIGCGEGWATRMLAGLAPEGSVIGLDVSDEMIHRAREQSAAYENALFLWASAEQIPWQEDFFTKVLAVEALYYVEDTERALREMYRVLAPGGSVWIINHLAKENELSLRWISDLKVPVHILSAEEYGALLRKCGFEHFSHRMLPGTRPILAGAPTAPFRDAAELHRFYETGALLLTASKPK
jgi:ubiquinone/menaquinone biosynthesis C-methylase UbiE